MTRILVLYYSTWGHVESMAEAAAEGVRQAGAEGVVKRVPETIPDPVLAQIHAKTGQAAPLADPNELADYDGMLIGTPTRYGNMAGQMRNFLDQTGKLWQAGALIGKPAGVFTSTGSQHGGQETTLIGTIVNLLHFGMVVVGLPYSATQQTAMDKITGGSPYGATTIAGSDGSRRPSPEELEMARFQGRHLAEIATRLKGP
ncbi:NAD(P)H:quinone oxidoreductase [Magnetospirillum sp. UT-4]|uniref:NAD(P)H:quinone oxidoreductase n=1 Tax=Magnetospirillum sp. UT-4 TaxID=2681467 RepID=UPI001383B431|nr:NAD(P)H:quinone oxidoreductase [Magnetospirillum sp. UT-4]CAA7618556.1 putative conserved flavoprotein [Magnetospirillum sp. UT-4]